MIIKQASLGIEVSYNLHNLTKLMQNSLIGESKTIMIANISPTKYDIAQTRETLDYAMKTGAITNTSSNEGLE
jgi:kinesin family protein 11